MKESPEIEEAARRMRPGMISRNGFLGRDARQLSQVLEADQALVNSLGIAHGDIANRMRYFTECGRQGLGTTVEVDEIYEVRVDEVRGKLPCPFPHRGLYPKVNVHIKNLKSGEELAWTMLNIHLIEEHGFYEGTGSMFHVDPAKAKRVLGIGSPGALPVITC